MTGRIGLSCCRVSARLAAATAATLFLSFVACSQGTGCLEETAGGDGTVSVGLSVVLPEATKAYGRFETCEDVIRDLQFFCFDAATGVLEDYRAVTTVSRVLVKCRKGDKRIYALVNVPDLSLIPNEKTLLKTVTSLSHNSLIGFEMVSALGEGASYRIEESCAFDMAVTRIVCKVLVDRVTGGITDVADEFVLTGMWLDNVAADNVYGLDGTPSEYLRGQDNNGANVNSLIADFGIGYDLMAGRSSDRVHGFYTYPNSSVENPTRLVLKARIDYEVQLYSVDLPPLESNCVYEVTDIVLTRRSPAMTAAVLPAAARVTRCAM